MDARLATLTEIEEKWSILDLCSAHVTLDMREDLERLVAKRMEGGR